MHARRSQLATFSQTTALLLYAILMVAWMFGSVGVARAEAGSTAMRQELAQLEAEQKDLEKRMEGEMRRIRRYLDYEDQILAMTAVVEPQPSGAQQKGLNDTAWELFRNSFSQAEFEALQQRHRQQSDGYLRRIEQAVDQSFQWPTDRTMTEYQALARRVLGESRQELARRRDDPAGARAALARAAEPLAWSRGQRQLSESANAFAGADGRLRRALASALVLATTEVASGARGGPRAQGAESISSGDIRRADLIRERPSDAGAAEPTSIRPGGAGRVATRAELPGAVVAGGAERVATPAEPPGEVLASTMTRVAAAREAVVKGPETFEMRVPAGALSESGSITIEQRPALSDAAGPDIVGSVWTIGVSNPARPAFDKPVTLLVPFDPAQMRGRPRDLSPGVGQWANGRWWQLRGVSMARDAVVARTQEAGTYAVVLLPSEHVTLKPADTPSQPDLTQLPPEPEIPGINVSQPAPGQAQAVELVEQGEDSWRTGSWDEAERTFREAIRLDPTSAAAHNGLGATLARRQDWAGAEAAFRQAYALAPDNYTYAGHIAIALARQRKDLPEAEQFIRRAIELKPDESDLHYQLGIIKGFMGQWPQAEAAYRQAITLKPEGGNYHACLAEALLEQGRTTEARQEAAQGKSLGATETRVYDKLAELPPTGPGASGPNVAAQPDQARLGELLWSNQLDAALEEARRLSEQHPDHPGVGVSRVGLEIFFGNMDVARTTAEHLLRLHPNHPNVLIARAQVANWEDERDETTMREMFRRALKIDPGIAGTYYNQGLQFFNGKVYSIAFQQFATVAAMSPNQMWMSRYYLGFCAECLGDNNGAVTQYEAFLRQNPPAEWANAARANLQRLRGGTN